MIKRIFPTGKNSSAVIIPRPMAKKYDLHSSDYIILEEKNGGIFLKKLELERII
ncbi:MAG: AbrB/MazE/SpoVT family DNA-binding domain-containing protein [Candidatus Nitrosocosmicus sp.]|nr:AbrB/MazE/SpoVT family DNA-binding domain-containing protein [Candidatus Nitrosocosmicus sp.]